MVVTVREAVYSHVHRRASRGGEVDGSHAKVMRLPRSRQKPEPAVCRKWNQMRDALAARALEMGFMASISEARACRGRSDDACDVVIGRSEDALAVTF